MGVRKPRILVCRYCGDECDASNRDILSWWSHNHPGFCPYRQDRVPALNGVHVGDVWRNLHTKEERVVTEIRLGGAGVYTDREPVVVFDGGGMGEHPMWSLVEHWEPISRPGEYPVPWTRSKRFRGRSAHQKWRTGGYRGRRKKAGNSCAYYHSYHHVDGYSIVWEHTNVLWQIDPEVEAREQQLENARLQALELIESGDPTLAQVGKRVLESFAEAA